ncbi:MAG: ABC transporter permease [Acidobacteria bacterium]|nr:ABC transporter permease [Acidobacteriota bacterium]
MNSSSDAMREAALGSEASAPAVMVRTRPFYWALRREFWENRLVFMAPLGVAGLYLVGYLISLTHLPAHLRGLSSSDPEHYRDAVLAPYNVAAGFMMATYILVTVFYCAEALHGERRDRSILFWKSLPVSDLTTVLAKASIPFVVLPLITFAITLVLQLTILMLSSVVLLASGLSVSYLWTRLPVVQMSLLLLYHIVTVHALWPAPVYCWLLLVSGWARRAAFVWAALPVLAISGVEKIVFHTYDFAWLVAYRLIGDSAPSHMPEHTFPTDPMTHIMPAEFLTSPSLWIGLALAAIFLAAAVRLRRSQGPI